MPAYLKIENVGVCPPEGFTVLGVSLADTATTKASSASSAAAISTLSPFCLRQRAVPGRLRRHAASWSSRPDRRP